MNAIEEKNGTLCWVPVESPAVEPGTVRIGVAATALNRADLVQRAGHYPPPSGVTEILGLECSGKVLEVGEGVSGWKVGDEVCALLAGGGYAEEVVVPQGHLLPVPSGLSLHQAAALPEAFTTAWLNLRREGGLRPGERVLVHAGASGVGTAAIQLCVAWGNPVVATVGSDKKCEYLQGLGVEAAVNRRNGPWPKAAKANGKFDLILDPVGGSYLEQNIWSLNPRGRLINIGLMGGREGNLPLAPVLTKRLQLKGSVLRSRSVEEKSDILAGVLEEVWPLLESGAVRPIIERTMPIQEAEQAHQLLASNKTVGKIVLKVGQDL